MQSFLRNNLFRSIRNTLNIKPTFSNLPNNENSSVSDFFFWINENGFNTNYQVANLADHATPDLKLDEILYWAVGGHCDRSFEMIGQLFVEKKLEGVEFKSTELTDEEGAN